MGKVRITQTKSSIDTSKKQKATLLALGLRKINHSVEKDLSPAIEGMLSKINHLVIIEKV
ncbi:MAG: 50S ribosomal protein L30 [Bacteroidetes bacterium]|jgi:large subunit ribosomal protein L30|nr:50S ribosomal protein L30 [Bacteroidota bacterium]